MSKQLILLASFANVAADTPVSFGFNDVPGVRSTYTTIRTFLQTPAAAAAALSTWLTARAIPNEVRGGAVYVIMSIPDVAVTTDQFADITLAAGQTLTYVCVTPVGSSMITGLLGGNLDDAGGNSNTSGVVMGAVGGFLAARLLG